MKRTGFTMAEMIVVIVIMSVLSGGTFVSLKHLYQKTAKTKALSNLLNDSQILVDQISSLVYDRVPNAVWGYKDIDTNKTQIYNIVSDDYKIVEWWGVANESLKYGSYSGFVDMDVSDGNRTLITYDINSADIKSILQKKFSMNDEKELAVVFAGAFDNGGDIIEHNLSSIENNAIVLERKPNEIYEKYYLADSAYAIARKEDINITACSVLNMDNNSSNTLFLFYNYRPWKQEKFCDGNATILSTEVKAFEIGIVNGSIFFNIELARKIRGVDSNVTISKQKVVF